MSEYGIEIARHEIQSYQEYMQELSDTYGFAEVERQSREALDMLQVKAKEIPITRKGQEVDPFIEIRRHDHRGEFTLPVALFYYANPDRQDFYRKFSNFSVHTDGNNPGFMLDDLPWTSVEHAYQAAKKIGISEEEYNTIHDTVRPDDAKKLANTGTIRSDWEEIKPLVMLRGLLATTVQHQEIKDLLKQTGDAMIVEDAHSDNCWGVGKDYTGKNMLGQSWVRVRNILEQSSEAEAIKIIEDSHRLIWKAS